MQKDNISRGKHIVYEGMYTLAQNSGVITWRSEQSLAAEARQSHSCSGERHTMWRVTSGKESQTVMCDISIAKILKAFLMGQNSFLNLCKESKTLINLYWFLHCCVITIFTKPAKPHIIPDWSKLLLDPTNWTQWRFIYLVTRISIISDVNWVKKKTISFEINRTSKVIQECTVQK